MKIKNLFKRKKKVVSLNEFIEQLYKVTNSRYCSVKVEITKRTSGYSGTNYDVAIAGYTHEKGFITGKTPKEIIDKFVGKEEKPGIEDATINLSLFDNDEIF